MHDATLKFPRRMESAEAIESSGINDLDFTITTKIRLDFSNCGFCDPFCMLYIGMRLREIKELYPRIEFELIGELGRFESFANFIGFFDFAGIGSTYVGKVGDAPGSQKYFPISVWNAREVRELLGGDPVGPLANEAASELTCILLQTDCGDAFDPTQYAVREILRNALEHSEAETVALLGLYWPTRKEAEIAVIDNGIGIAENIYDNEFVEVSNNLAAIKVSLLPGITGVSRSDRIEQHEHCTTLVSACL